MMVSYLLCDMLFDVIEELCSSVFYSRLAHQVHASLRIKIYASCTVENEVLTE